VSAVSHPALSVHDVKQCMSCPSSNSLEASYGRWCSKSVACKLKVGSPNPHPGIKTFKCNPSFTFDSYIAWEGYICGAGHSYTNR